MYGTTVKKKIKCVFWFPLQVSSATFLIIKIIKRYIYIYRLIIYIYIYIYCMYIVLHVKYPLFLSDLSKS